MFNICDYYVEHILRLEKEWNGFKTYKITLKEDALTWFDFNYQLFDDIFRTWMTTF